MPASGGVLVTWRMLGDDPEGVTFRLYRGDILIQETTKTNYLDTGGSSSSTYEIRAVVNGTETKGGTASVWANGRLYTTPHPTEHRLPTLMHDPVHRLGIAWQNVGYNPPPQVSYYLGTK